MSVLGVWHCAGCRKITVAWVRCRLPFIRRKASSVVSSLWRFPAEPTGGGLAMNYGDRGGYSHLYGIQSQVGPPSTKASRGS